MKKLFSMILCLGILLTSINAFADYNLNQTVPFGIIVTEGDADATVYKKASTKSVVDNLTANTICQILDEERISSVVWYKIKYFNSDIEQVGYVMETSLAPLSVAGLILRMADADTADYMQNFIGLSLLSDSENITESGTRNALIPATPTIAPAPTVTPKKVAYILNVSSKKFHYPSCSGVEKMSEKNKREFEGTREEAIKMGYSPCGICNP